MRVHSGFTPLRKAIATLAIMVVGVSQTSVSPNEPPNSDKAIATRSTAALQNPEAHPAEAMMPMPLVAPLFLQDQRFSSVISLVNASSENTYAKLTIRSLGGATILQKKVNLLPSSPRYISLLQLLQEANSTETRGSIVIEQSPELQGLGVLAQLSITYQGAQASYIDEEFAMPDPAKGSQVLRGVVRTESKSALVAITSLSSANQQIRVDCVSHEAAVSSKTVNLTPSATIILRPCGEGEADLESAEDDASRTNQDESGGAGIHLVSSAGPGQFAAFGITRRHLSGDFLLGSLPFNDPKLTFSSSTVFAGVPVGPTDLLPAAIYKPYLAVANFSSHPAHVTVTFSATLGSGENSAASSSTVREFTLPGLQAKTVFLGGAQGSPDLRNSFIVSSDAAPGDILASLASADPQDGREVELLGKDAKQPENAGAHPWSIANGDDSTLLIFNHSAQRQRVFVTVMNGLPLWQKTFYLSPHETLAESIRELIKDRITDDSKRTLSPKLQQGEIMWTMERPGTISGRLLRSNSVGLMGRNFSCGAYVILCGVTINPTSATMALGQSTVFEGNATQCIGYTPNSCSGAGSAGGASVSYSWNGGAQVDTSGCSGGGTFCNAAAASPGTGLVTVTAQLSVFNGCSFSASSFVTVTPTVSVSCTKTDLALGPTAPTSTTNGSCTATVNPSGGSYSWAIVTNTSNVPITLNGSGATATYAAANPSQSVGDAMINVLYTINQQSASANSSPITVHKPTSLAVLSDTTNPSGYACNGLACLRGDGTCDPGSGTCSYNGPLRTRQYDVLDQLNQRFSTVGLSSISGTETVNLTSNSFPDISGVTTGTSPVTPFPDNFFICSRCCLPTGPGGSASASQTISVNGLSVRSETINLTCTTISLTP